MAEIKVITIGRHYCAGGSTIGKLVAEKLGIPCYDREIIDMAAQKSGIAMSEIQKYEEAALSILKTPINLFSKEKEYPITEKIFAAETEVIMELVSKGNCVIVGRCADFILKNKVKTLNVFINASFEKRQECAIEKHNIPRTRWKQGSKSMTENVPTITTPTPTKSGEIFLAMICALTAASLATKCAPR